MAVDEPGMLTSWRALIESGATRLFPGHGGVVSIDRIMPVFHRANAAVGRLDEAAAITEV
jgi:glyoxylase-like metal-dependent hydrolase (beta-lactamase superfamily II)